MPINGSSGCQPALSAWVQVGLTDTTRPLTLQLVRDVASCVHFVAGGTGEGPVVSDKESTRVASDSGTSPREKGALL